MSVGQAEFAAAILDPQSRPPDDLSDPQGRAAGKRFDVYRNNVAVSLTEALETAFPAVRALVGLSNFKLLAGVYLRKHPPQSPLMMFYGEHMPAFLASFEPTRRYPYLPDLARLELARRQSYHAADAKPIAADLLASLPAARLLATRLAFAPPVRLIRSRWPVLGLWRQATESAPQPAMAGENVLVARPEFDPVMTALPPGGGTFVAALLAGAALGKALDETLARLSDFDPTETLSILARDAAVTGLVEDAE